MKRNAAAFNTSQMSLANKYGVSMKENSSLASMGMNPNLNLEDEYIENLLKQIHFMNLEIKLIKEKQQNSDSNALWSLINKSKDPMVSNIVFSNQKYQNFKHHTSKQINNLEHQITNLDSSQHSLLSELALLENRKRILDEEIKNKLEAGNQKNMMFEETIKSDKQKLKEVSIDKANEETKRTELAALLSGLQNQKERDDYIRSRQQQSIKNEEEIEKKIEADVDEKIKDITSKIQQLQKLFESNQDYVKASIEQTQLRDKLSILDKNIIGANFELMQLNQSLKMAENQKQHEIRERNKLTENIESNKLILFSILQMNSTRKDKQSLYRQKQSPQIKKAEEQKFKLEKNLEDVKKKLAKATEAENTIHAEVHNLQILLKGVKEEHQTLSHSLSCLLQSNSKKQSELLELNSEVKGLSEQYEKYQRQDAFFSGEQLEVSREIEYLKKKNEILRQRVSELGQIIRGLKIDDLSKTVKKNEDFNRTVEAVMSKWNEIQDFGRI